MVKEADFIGSFTWVILTVYHEARGESKLGQKNVAKVILNRSHQKGWLLKDIVFARKQFSCWNKGIRDPSVYVRELEALDTVADNCWEAYREWQAGDRLGGATHYYAIKGMIDGKPPWWAPGMKFICQVEGHRFLKEE